MEQTKTQFDVELEKFKKSLETKTTDELLNIEADIIKEQDEFDSLSKEFCYKFPEKIDFDNEKITNKEVVKKIIYFLNKQETSWQFTLGMYELINFWKKYDNKSDIPHGTYDSTLRLLGQMKFKGHQEFEDILIINEAFTVSHPEYVKNIETQMYISSKHNAVLDKMQVKNNE